MIELSRSLNFRVVAEHVEDQLSLDTVTRAWASISCRDSSSAARSPSR